jgi:hypothetical protein
MKLKDPDGLKVRFREEKDWYTDAEIARGCGLSESTVNSAFAGSNIKIQTARSIAAGLNLKAFEIADEVKK